MRAIVTKTINIISTSRDSATVSDIVVREGKLVRLIFRAQIVNNDEDPAACVRGRFIYQKKAKNESWSDVPATPLTSIRKGEEYQLELHAGELLPLLHELGALYRVHRREGIPKGRLEFIKVGQELAQFLQLSEKELNDFLASNPRDATRTLQRLLRWLSDNPAVAEDLAGDELPQLNALVGLANLKAVHGIWKRNSTNANEEFWQGTLTKYSFVLSQLFAYPLVIVSGKAYVGGKQYDNRHGNLADFLGQITSSAIAVIIEIKTPVTPLLGPEYRQDVYPPSSEVAGALAQVLKYRDTFLLDFDSITREKRSFVGTEPRCVVIAGCSERDLTDDAKKRSFERFRERIAGVTIVTYDELFARVGDLIDLLESSVSLESD